MSSNIDERIDQIVDGLAQVLQTAITHQKTAINSVAQLDNVSKNLSQKIERLEGQIRDEIQSSVQQEIEGSLKNSFENVFNELLEKFKTANVNAIQAANTYHQANEQCQKTMSLSIWGVCALAAGVSGVISMIFTIIAINFLMPYFFSNLSMTDLLSASQITDCSDGKKKRLCAKIDEKIKVKDGYRYVLMKTK
jgi:hypothetical protein